MNKLRINPIYLMKIFYSILPFLTAAALVERNNLQLRALQQNNEASRLEIQAQNNLQQDLSISYSPFFTRGYDGVASSELVVSMGFDFPSQYVSRGKSGKLQNEVLDMQYALQRRDILLQAQLLCLDLVRINQEKELLDTRMANADELLALMEKRFAEGGANIIEVNKVKMERMNVRTLAAQNEAARQNALQSLRAMNGNIPMELLAAEYPAVSDIVDYDEFYAEVMATDAGILSAEASVDAAAQEIKVNRQNWLPKFEVGYRRNTSMTEASHGFLVGASLPLFSSRPDLRRAPDAQHPRRPQVRRPGRPDVRHRLLRRSRQRLRQPLHLPLPREPVPQAAGGGLQEQAVALVVTLNLIDDPLPGRVFWRRILFNKKTYPPQPVPICGP